MKLHTETFIGAKFDNDISNFYRRLHRSKIPFVSKPTRMHTLLLQPLFYLKNSLTNLENTFREIANRVFYERKIWQRHFFLFQKLLGCILSYCSLRFIWTSSWLDWKTLFVKLHTESFIGANFIKDISTFFVYYTDQKCLLLQSLLGCIHSYYRPHSIWTSPWLDWKTLWWNCIATLFWALNLTTTWVLFS